jgi:hypothetical protein
MTDISLVFYEASRRPTKGTIKRLKSVKRLTLKMTPKTKQEKMVTGAYKLFLTLVSIEPIPWKLHFPSCFCLGVFGSIETICLQHTAGGVNLASSLHQSAGDWGGSKT